VLAFSPSEGSITWKYRDRNFAYFSSPALTETQVLIGGRDKRLASGVGFGRIRAMFGRWLRGEGGQIGSIPRPHRVREVSQARSP